MLKNNQKIMFPTCHEKNYILSWTRTDWVWFCASWPSAKPRIHFTGWNKAGSGSLLYQMVQILTYFPLCMGAEEMKKKNRHTIELLNLFWRNFVITTKGTWSKREKEAMYSISEFNTLTTILFLPTFSSFRERGASILKQCQLKRTSGSL